jgi:hypothetical protein
MYRMLRAVLPGMVAQGGGSIINMASVAGPLTAPPNRFIYSASKAAVGGITKSVAQDYVKQGIRCNAVCPGYVLTPLVESQIPDTMKARGLTREQVIEDVLLAVVDGLKGFPEAITAVFPDAMVQTCIVHLLRHSLDFVSYKDRKPVAAALKEIYKRLRPGEPPTTANAKALLKRLFFDPKRYDLGRVGRYKINQKLFPSRKPDFGTDDANQRIITNDDAPPSPRQHVLSVSRRRTCRSPAATAARPLALLREGGSA